MAVEALEQLIQEYRTKPHTPELVTAYWRIRWSVLGSRVGLDIEVADTPYHQDEISGMEQLPVPRAPIYVPSELTTTPAGLILLGRMHPRMASWTVNEGTTVRHTNNRGGWVDIESGWQTPYTNTTHTDLVNVAEWYGWDGQRLVTYIIGAQNSFDLTGHYFDEQAGVRLRGSRGGDRVVHAFFRPNGYLDVSWGWHPSFRYPNLGGRFEGVKKFKTLTLCSF